MIDREIKAIIDREYQKAIAILQDKKQVLTRGAKLLLEKEKIAGEELQALIDEENANRA